MERFAGPGDGTEVAIAAWGDPAAPPLLLLHGIGSRAESWLPVADPLSARFRVLALDLRGHGASGRPPTGYGLPDYVADLDRVVRGLGLDRPPIVGHSLGALVALLWAAEHPSRAGRLVAEDPPLRTRPDILPAFDGWQQLNRAPVEHVAAWFAGEHPDWTPEACRRRAEAICSVHPAVFAELRAEAERNLATGRVERLEEMAALAVPTLLLRGEPDLGSMTLAADAARLRAIAPDLREVVIAGAGHNLHREQPDRFLDAVVPFLTA